MRYCKDHLQIPWTQNPEKTSSAAIYQGSSEIRFENRNQPVSSIQDLLLLNQEAA
jgi:hypothetical protein